MDQSLDLDSLPEGLSWLLFTSLKGPAARDLSDHPFRCALGFARIVVYMSTRYHHLTLIQVKYRCVCIYTPHSLPFSNPSQVFKLVWLLDYQYVGVKNSSFLYTWKIFFQGSILAYTASLPRYFEIVVFDTWVNYAFAGFIFFLKIFIILSVVQRKFLTFLTGL